MKSIEDRLEDIKEEMGEVADAPAVPPQAPEAEEAAAVPVADRIFFDVPGEPEDERQKELVHIPAVLVLPRYKMHILREIMTKLGMKIMRPTTEKEEK